MGQIAKEPEEMKEVVDLEDGGGQSHYIGLMGKVVLGIAVVWTIFQLYMSSYGIMDAIKFRAWHLAFLLVLGFVLYPAKKGQGGTRARPSAWDFICVALTIISMGYFLLTYDAFVRERYGNNVLMDYVMGGIAMLLLFEASRRVVGNGLTLIAAFFLSYNFFGAFIPGAFGHNGFSIERIINVMFWGGQGIFGTALAVSATYIFVFVMFGAFLKNSGFTDFINDLALTIAGRTSGGPAKVSILASGLMGMMSGSAVGNVVTTGAVTIPLMKKTGYKPKFAAAVESVASTGGLLAPPIMGAAAFIMAEFLGVPYTTIILAAIIPAILYYGTLFMVVHFEAKRLGLSGIAKENIPNAIKVFKEGGHLLIPLIVLMGALLTGVTPLFAAIWALVATVLASWLRKSTRMGIRVILSSIEEGARGAVNVGIACAIVGVVVGTITLTSVGLTVGNNVINMAGDNVLIAALLTMVISVFLGMGVPATAAYIIVAAISVPILVNMGVPALAAHMFAFYYAALSSITPPVALASYAAAGIAKADPTQVSFESMRIGAIGFILPFFFLFNPVLLFDGGSVGASIFAGITALIGGVALAGALVGWFIGKLNWFDRALLTVGGILLIFPEFVMSMTGLGVVVVGIVLQMRNLNVKNVLEKEKLSRSENL